MSKPLWLVVLTSGLLLLASGRAAAVGAGERQVSGAVGFALAEDDAVRAGVQGALEGAVGISDSWAARATIDASLHPGSSGQPRRLFSALTFGFTYAFDVLRTVPFVDIALTLAEVHTTGADERLRLGPQGGIGLEYLLSRRWTVAGLARVEYLGLRLAGDTEPQPWRMVVGLRLGRVF